MKKTIGALALSVALGVSLQGVVSAAPVVSNVDESVHLVTPGSFLLIDVPNEATKEAVHNFVKAWQKHAVATKGQKEDAQNSYANLFARYDIAQANAYRDYRAKVDVRKHRAKEWYASFPDHGNTQGDTASYSYQTLFNMVARVNALLERQVQAGGPYTDDEAARLEEAMLAILSQDQVRAPYEDLRGYMDEAIWYAATQTVKERAALEKTQTNAK